MKRCFDLSMALVGLVILLPLLILVGLAVTLFSGWPIFFRQIRVGRGGRNFTLVKFRTMGVLREAESGSFDVGSGHRVTSVGRILRKTKLDELPQLWNVVTGDMSLVGPRPEVRFWVEAFPGRWAKVLIVRPGITDPASIEFRNEEAILARESSPEQTYRNVILPRKLDLYEVYVSQRSFWGDVGILLKTVWAVIRGTKSSRN